MLTVVNIQQKQFALLVAISQVSLYDRERHPSLLVSLSNNKINLVGAVHCYLLLYALFSFMALDFYSLLTVFSFLIMLMSQAMAHASID